MGVSSPSSRHGSISTSLLPHATLTALGHKSAANANSSSSGPSPYAVHRGSVGDTGGWVAQKTANLVARTEEEMGKRINNIGWYVRRNSLSVR